MFSLDDPCKNMRDPITVPSYCHPRGGGTIGGALLRGRDRLRKKDLHTSQTSRSATFGESSAQKFPAQSIFADQKVP